MNRPPFLLVSVFGMIFLLAGAGCSSVQPMNVVPEAVNTSDRQVSDDGGRDEWENEQESERENEWENEQESEQEDDTERGAPTTSSVNAVQPAAATTGIYTMDDVAAADSANKCWTVVSGKVYDLTKEITRHPGGEQAILGLCGQDSTAAFNAQHGGQRRPMTELAGSQIGILR